MTTTTRGMTEPQTLKNEERKDRAVTEKLDRHLGRAEGQGLPFLWKKPISLTITCSSCFIPLKAGVRVRGTQARIALGVCHYTENWAVVLCLTPKTALIENRCNAMHRIVTSRP